MTNCESPSGPIEEAVCDALETNVPREEIDIVVAETVRNLENQRPQSESVERLQQTLAYIGNEERIFFLEFFSAPADPDGFVNSIREVQGTLGFSENDRDGIIGPYTLSQIYLRYYQHYPERLTQIQINRLEIYDQMQNYPDRNVYNAQGEYERTISVSSTPNAFDDRRYWGGESFSTEGVNPVNNFRPREGSMIANGIIDAGFDILARRDPNTIYIEFLGGKHIVLMYDENGDCELATYTSPGDASRGANGRYEINALQNTNMHHMSNDLNGAPMPYGINISDWNIMLHSGVGVVNGDNESAGCYRVALGYASHIFSRVREMGNFTLIANI